jgi:hypothetical protein
MSCRFCHFEFKHKRLPGVTPIREDLDHAPDCPARPDGDHTGLHLRVAIAAIFARAHWLPAAFAALSDEDLRAYQEGVRRAAAVLVQLDHAIAAEVIERGGSAGPASIVMAGVCRCCSARCGLLAGMMPPHRPNIDRLDYRLLPDGEGPEAAAFSHCTGTWMTPREIVEVRS